MGHQRCDHRLAVQVAELEHLQAGDDKVIVVAGLVCCECGLAVAGTRCQVHPMRAGRREDRVLDERGGGINRHTGIIEGREFARQLTEQGVPGSVIRVEDRSKDTWQNVELSLPYLREALAMGLRLAVVSKWYHLRAVCCLATLLPEAAPFYAISWEPVYAGTLVTRASWPKIPDGRRRVLRESDEVPRRVADGTYRTASKADGMWQLS